MRYTRLGRTELRVSELGLGAATFGSKWGPAWTMTRREAARTLGTALDHGVNLVDTSNVYNRGESESMLGELLARQGLRDRVILSTKFGYRTDPDDPTSGGCSAVAVRRAIERSLRRLRTDHVDLYYVHLWDDATPPEETLAALDDLVTAGTVRHVGLSNVPGWYAGAWDALAAAGHGPRPAAVQLQHNLLVRVHEQEFLPYLRHRDVGLVCWGPLANGLLAGRYELDHETRTVQGVGRMTRNFTTGDVDPFTDQTRRVLAELDALVAETGRTHHELSLGWLLAREETSSVLLGVSSPEQLAANLAVADSDLPPEVLSRLDIVSRPTVEHPWTFLEPDVQQLVHGVPSPAGEDQAAGR
jgi:aryl-alcohol dehydrogenase-like predicted oxidoreductase